MKPSELSELYDREYNDLNLESITEFLTEKIKYCVRDGVDKKTIIIYHGEIIEQGLSPLGFETFLKEYEYSYSQSSRGNALKPEEDKFFILDLTK